MNHRTAFNTDLKLKPYKTLNKSCDLILLYFILLFLIPFNHDLIGYNLKYFNIGFTVDSHLSIKPGCSVFPQVFLIWIEALIKIGKIDIARKKVTHYLSLTTTEVCNILKKNNRR